MRLADRQGVLRGRRINRVQRRAIDLLRMVEAREQAKHEAEEFALRLKLAVATANPRALPDLWPDLFGITDEEEVYEDDIEALESNEPVTWVMPTEEPISEEEAMRILEQLTKQTSVSLSLDDLDENAGWM